MTKLKKLYIIDEEAGGARRGTRLVPGHGWQRGVGPYQLATPTRQSHVPRSRLPGTTHPARTANNYALDRDQKALAWAIHTLVQYIPSEEKEHPEPPKKPRQSSRRLSSVQWKAMAGKSSWNDTPKRGWRESDLPRLQQSVIDGAAERRWGVPRDRRDIGAAEPLQHVSPIGLLASRKAGG